MDGVAVDLISNFVAVDDQAANFVVAETIQPFSEARVNQKLIGRTRQTLNHSRRYWSAPCIEECVQTQEVP